jgi:xanthine dehydrogenase accessory factor
MFGLIDDVRDAIHASLAISGPAALATLVRADGPTPRPIGAQFLSGQNGAAGYVSGGCVEASLEILGQEASRRSASRWVRFGKDSPYADVRLVCGSSIEIFIEPLQRSDASWRTILDARDARRAIVRSAGIDADAEIREATDHDGICWVDAHERVCRRYDPNLRLVVAGQDPVALALVAIANAAGLETILVRGKGPSARAPNLSGEYLSAVPADAIAALKPDKWTAIVTTTHDLDEDHEVLSHALPSPAFYVGALGSRRRLDDRIALLEAAGIGGNNLARLRAPVGLDIGARTPAEIAVSIVADLIRVQRGK